MGMIAGALLAMAQEAFSAAFKGWPLKRVKLRGSKHQCGVVLGNIGDRRDVELLVGPETR